MSWIRILIRIPIKIQKQDQDPDPDPAPHYRKIQKVRSLKRNTGGPQTLTMEAQRIKMVADSHHFNEEQDLDPFQSESRIQIRNKVTVRSRSRSASK
jgi:hypothetical protein